MVDRLNIDKKHLNTIDKIDELDYLGLGKESSDRIDLFLFAMGIGIKLGERTHLAVKHGFILASAVDNRPDAKAAIFSLLADFVRKTNEEDKIDNRDLAFEIAEEYANTGLIKLAEGFKQESPRSHYSFIKEMTSMFESYFEYEEDA